MAVNTDKDFIHFLLEDSKVEVSTRNSSPPFGDNAATNSDGPIKSVFFLSYDDDDEEIVTREGNRYTCLVCDQVCRNNIHIVVHLKREHNLSLYICDICGDDFRNETDLSHHMEDHVAKNFDKKCDVCIKIFTRLRLLCPDKKAHYEPPEIFWPCPICSLFLRTKEALEQHVQMRHTEEPYICRGCDKCTDIIIKYTYEPGELEAQFVELKKKHPDLVGRIYFLFERSYRAILDKESLLDYNDHYYSAKFGGKKIQFSGLYQLLKMKKKFKNDPREGNENSRIPFLSINKAKETTKQSKKVSISGTPIDIQFTRRDGNRYTCLICRGDNKESRDVKGILAHLKEEHYMCFDICDICRNYFSRRRDLISIRQHNLTPFHPGDLNCKTCHDTCSRLQLFRLHKHFHGAQKYAFDGHIKICTQNANWL